MNLSRLSKNVENRRFFAPRLALDSDLDSKNEHERIKQTIKVGQTEGQFSCLTDLCRYCYLVYKVFAGTFLIKKMPFFMKFFD